MEGTHPDLRDEEVYEKACSFIWNLFDKCNVKNENNPILSESLTIGIKKDISTLNIDDMLMQIDDNFGEYDILNQSNKKKYELPANLGDFLKYFERLSQKVDQDDPNNCDNYEYKPEDILPEKLKNQFDKLVQKDKSKKKSKSSDLKRIP